ncbi:hypothetical protein T484DRAFT_1788404 [Baffinella frigidus]|nr:hypothetical protein T484DRAFT_1788404 [Cryptophyta sp. CCMP2293]
MSRLDLFCSVTENVAVADITSQNNNTFVEAVDEELGTSNVFRFLKIGDELIQLSDESKYAEDEEEGGKVEVDANGTCTGYTRDDNRTIIGANFGMTSFTSASRIGVTATEFTEWISDTVVQVMMSAGVGVAWSTVVMMSAGVGAAWSAVMSVGNQFGTQSEAYTYDKARSAMQFAGDNYRKLVATLGMQSVTMVGGYRVDVPWTTAVSERNYPGSPSAEQLLQVVTGKNFGVVEMTDIKARMGGTAAELTAWTTDTGIKALILWPPMLSAPVQNVVVTSAWHTALILWPPMLSEPVQNVVVTSARHSGTSNNLFSYDAPQIRVEFLGDVMRNARAVGGKIFTVLGANLGSSFLSQGARVGGSSTELTSWMSESALEVKISAGVGDTLPVVAFVAQEMGTVTEALSYDQPAASNIDESSLKKDDDYSDYSQRWDEIIRLASYGMPKLG